MGGRKVPGRVGEFLFEAGHFDPQFAGIFKEREVIHRLWQLQQLAAARAEMRAQRALVAIPADERRICGCGGCTHKLFFKIAKRHKKSGWRVRLPTTCQARLLVSPAGTKSKAKSTG